MINEEAMMTIKSELKATISSLVEANFEQLMKELEKSANEREGFGMVDLAIKATLTSSPDAIVFEDIKLQGMRKTTFNDTCPAVEVNLAQLELPIGGNE